MISAIQYVNRYLTQSSCLFCKIERWRRSCPCAAWSTTS